MIPMLCAPRCRVATTTLPVAICQEPGVITVSAVERNVAYSAPCAPQVPTRRSLEPRRVMSVWRIPTRLLGALPQLPAPATLVQQAPTAVCAPNVSRARTSRAAEMKTARAALRMPTRLLGVSFALPVRATLARQAYMVVNININK